MEKKTGAGEDMMRKTKHYILKRVLADPGWRLGWSGASENEKEREGEKEVEKEREREEDSGNPPRGILRQSTLKVCVPCKKMWR